MHQSPIFHREAMVTFGFSTQVDMLSWLIVLTLGAKLVATLILLALGKDNRDRPGWGATLWWITKLTPIIAVPCMIWLTWVQGMTSLSWLFFGLMAFVVIAVPFKVRQRRDRVASRNFGN